MIIRNKANIKMKFFLTNYKKENGQQGS